MKPKTSLILSSLMTVIGMTLFFIDDFGFGPLAVNIIILLAAALALHFHFFKGPDLTSNLATMLTFFNTFSACAMAFHVLMDFIGVAFVLGWCFSLAIALLIVGISIFVISFAEGNR